MYLSYLTRAVRKDANDLPVVRKVFRQNGEFICGICRQHHDRRENAFKCLDQCWNEVLQSTPVVGTFRGRNKAFKCRFCCRVYIEEKEAMACAMECIELRKSQHYASMKIAKVPANKFHSRAKYHFVSFQKGEIKSDYVSRFNLRRKGTSSAVQVETHIEEENDSTEETKDTVAPPKKTKADYPKPFIRNHAKYECMYCHELYFTKIEVDKCFNGHFDSDGVEID